MQLGPINESHNLQSDLCTARAEEIDSTAQARVPELEASSERGDTEMKD